MVGVIGSGDPVAAEASVRGYRQLEARSGISFWSDAGVLQVCVLQLLVHGLGYACMLCGLNVLKVLQNARNAPWTRSKLTLACTEEASFPYLSFATPVNKRTRPSFLFRRQTKAAKHPSFISLQRKYNDKKVKIRKESIKSKNHTG